MCRGACQCAHRLWWRKVRGYDETFDGGLNHQDLDIEARAKKDGLEIKWIPWSRAQVFHRWHPPSKYKNPPFSTRDVYGKDMRVVKNDDGWGEMVYDSFYEPFGEEE